MIGAWLVTSYNPIVKVPRIGGRKTGSAAMCNHWAMRSLAHACASLGNFQPSYPRDARMNASKIPASTLHLRTSIICMCEPTCWKPTGSSVTEYTHLLTSIRGSVSFWWFLSEPTNKDFCNYLGACFGEQISDPCSSVTTVWGALRAVCIEGCRPLELSAGNKGALKISTTILKNIETGRDANITFRLRY